MFGGNSNWRGPVWMPLNYLAIRQFVIYHEFFGDDFKVEYPTGSGTEFSFGEIAQDLADRLVSIWLRGRTGVGRSTEERSGSRRIRRGKTISSSTSTSTETTARAWAQSIRRAGRLWSPT